MSLNLFFRLIYFYYPHLRAMPFITNSSAEGQCLHLYVSFIFNMNSKLFSKRHSCMETPIKRPEQPVPAQYFSRHAQELQPKTMINIDLTNKQNHNPNHPPRDSSLDQHSATPKRKVIHLKSVSKNSRSRKDGSGSNNKKYSAENSFAEVTDFVDGSYNNPRPSLVIQVDLKKHRRSIQDTLVSSSGLNDQSIKMEHPSCFRHQGKKATYMVRGQPHCDKCAVKEITRGLIAVKIKQQAPQSYNYNQSFELSRNQRIKRDKKQQRSEKLSNFIQQLDKIQPSLEGLHENIDLYLSWISEYCCSESQKFELNWQRMMQYLGQVKKRVLSDMLAHCEKNCQVLNQAKAKIRQEIENLSFMRNDIITNISNIVDENKVTESKFQEVIIDFTDTLRAINESSSRIRSQKCTIPKIQFDMARLNQEINKHARVHLVSEQMHLEGRQGKLVRPEDLGEDAYRMSFGRETQKIQSPTFKVI